MRSSFAEHKGSFPSSLKHLLRFGLVVVLIFFVLFLSDSRWRGMFEVGVAAPSGKVKAISTPKRARAHNYADPENAPLSFRAANMELYVRMSYERGWNETRSVLLPSLQLFWPHVSIVICLDAEAKADQRAVLGIAKQVAEEFPPLKARSVLVADHPLLKGDRGYGGWQRGQLDMMFADMVVKARHVALCDTDALFATLVTPQALFSAGGKPIVIGSVGRAAQEPLWATAAAASKFFLKKNSVMNCMSFFPVILVTRHIREMRDYVEKIHGKSFLEVYKIVLVKFGFYCHFTFMCNYVWYFHQNMYEFHYQNYGRFRPGWDAPQPNVVKDYSFVNGHSSKPIVRVSVHLSWTRFGDIPFVEAVLKRGRRIIGHLRNRYDPLVSSPILAHSFCYVCLAQCQNTEECASLRKACSSIGANENKLQVALFRFELFQSWEWSPGLLDAQNSYYRTLRNYSSWISYGKRIMSQFHPAIYEKLHL